MKKIIPRNSNKKQDGLDMSSQKKQKNKKQNLATFTDDKMNMSIMEQEQDQYFEYQPNESNRPRRSRS